MAASDAEMTSLRDDLSISERATAILAQEPFLLGLRSQAGTEEERRPLAHPGAGEAGRRIVAAHGTNLAAVLSALRNTDAALFPIADLESLGDSLGVAPGGAPLWAGGATPLPYLAGGAANPLRRAVFGTDVVRYGARALDTAEDYARKEAGAAPKLPGTRSEGRPGRSEAARIAAVVVGELADPAGTGAGLNARFRDPPEDVARGIPEGNPLRGKTRAEIADAFADQVVGEWLDVRAIFVGHPTDAGEDARVLELVEELVDRAGRERGRDLRRGDGIARVGLLRREVAAFKAFLREEGREGATLGEIREYLISPLDE